MKIRRGDLITLALANVYDVIVQGCNCFNTMGAGFARQIRNVFPEAYEADLRTKRGDKNKLGTFSSASVVRGNHGITIINAYTQYRYGSDTPDVDYAAIDSVFKALRTEYEGKNMRIGYPKIGCGLAGGDWSIVSNIINTNLQGMDHTLVIK